jgi:hypothetical protein
MPTPLSPPPQRPSSKWTKRSCSPARKSRSLSTRWPNQICPARQRKMQHRNSMTAGGRLRKPRSPLRPQTARCRRAHRTCRLPRPRHHLSDQSCFHGQGARASSSCLCLAGRNASASSPWLATGGGRRRGLGRRRWRLRCTMEGASSTPSPTRRVREQRRGIADPQRSMSEIIIAGLLPVGVCIGAGSVPLEVRLANKLRKRKSASGLRSFLYGQRGLL